MRVRCLDCHKEIAWLIESGRGLHAREAKGDCEGCHPEHAGRNFDLVRFEEGSPERFDHRRTGWSLAGRHASLTCRECHQEKYRVSEAARLSPRKGSPGGWVGLETACETCHKDPHRGALGSGCPKCHGLDSFKPAAGFDHARTDYPLTGRHETVRCAQCHLAERLVLATDANGERIPLYKPLPHADCVDCHADPHSGTLGRPCARCHVTDGFQRVDRRAFDHDRTRYPLRGKHVGLDCARCHDPAKAWGPKPAFAACGNCHRDAHAGQATLAGAPADCSSCHDVEGYDRTTFTVDRHRATRFPLQGKHRDVKCDGCHPKNPPGFSAERLGTAGILLRRSFAKCMDCHADAHGGQLAGHADGGACESCHRVDGWRPSTFTVSDHAKLQLPLEGRHARIPCAACHGPERELGLPALPGPEKLGSARVALTIDDATCTRCHEDPHRGRFSAEGDRARARRCLECHGTDSFVPSTVDVAVHQGFEFPLEGAHRAVPCDGCHPEEKLPTAASSLIDPGGTSRELPYKVRDRTCAGCHRSPHGDQFAHRADHGACDGCHGLESFRPATRFAHDRDSRFRLVGAHAKLACDRCHSPRPDASGRSVVRYRPLGMECTSCHAQRSQGVGATGA